MTKQEKATVARMREIAALLEEFGLNLSGFDPGVSATFINNPATWGHGYFGEPIQFDRSEWQWLEPLLLELHEFRKRAKRKETRKKEQERKELERVLNVPFRFGLVNQGHIPTIEKMLAEGKNWKEIGDAIGWLGGTARSHYERYVEKK